MRAILNPAVRARTGGCCWPRKFTKYSAAKFHASWNVVSGDAFLRHKKSHLHFMIIVVFRARKLRHERSHGEPAVHFGAPADKLGGGLDNGKGGL